MKGKTYTIAEEWCFGYMKGRSLDEWSALPESLRPSLEAIALHGLEKNFPVIEKMSPAQFEQTVALIQPAALALHQHWLAQRMPADTVRPAPVRREAGLTGRNDLCPCGSGKKFKKCCLH